MKLSDLIRDPILAAIFRRAERDGRDGLPGAEIDRPEPPRHDGGEARARVLELA